MMFELIRDLLAIFGACVVLYYGALLAYSLVDALIYAIGYLIFNLMNVNKEKAVKRPINFIRVMGLWVLDSFVDRLLGRGTVTEIRNDKHIWKPYFHYAKRGQ
jgi:hypothetical protein